MYHLKIDKGAVAYICSNTAFESEEIVELVGGTLQMSFRIFGLYLSFRKKQHMLVRTVVGVEVSYRNRSPVIFNERNWYAQNYFLNVPERFAILYLKNYCI